MKFCTRELQLRCFSIACHWSILNESTGFALTLSRSSSTWSVHQVVHFSIFFRILQIKKKNAKKCCCFKWTLFCSAIIILKSSRTNRCSLFSILYSIFHFHFHPLFIFELNISIHKPNWLPFTSFLDKLRSEYDGWPINVSEKRRGIF